MTVVIKIRSVLPGAKEMQCDMRELSGEIEMFYVFIGVVVTRLYICQKSSLAHLKRVHFMCKLYHKKKLI